MFRSPDGHAAVVVEALAVGEPAAPRAMGPEVARVTPDNKCLGCHTPSLVTVP